MTKKKPGELTGRATCLCGAKRYDLGEIAKADVGSKTYLKLIEPCDRCEGGPAFRVADVTPEGVFGPTQEVIYPLEEPAVVEKKSKTNKKPVRATSRPQKPARITRRPKRESGLCPACGKGLTCEKGSEEARFECERCAYSVPALVTHGHGDNMDESMLEIPLTEEPDLWACACGPDDVGCLWRLEELAAEAWPKGLDAHKITCPTCNAGPTHQGVRAPEKKLKTTVTCTPERIGEILQDSVNLLQVADLQEKKIRAGERRHAWLGALETVGEIRARARVERLTYQTVLDEIEEFLVRNIRIAEFQETGKAPKIAPTDQVELEPGVYKRTARTAIILVCPKCKMSFHVAPGESYVSGHTECAVCRGPRRALLNDPARSGEATGPSLKVETPKQSERPHSKGQTSGATIHSFGKDHTWQPFGDPSEQSMSSQGTCSCGFGTGPKCLGGGVTLSRWLRHAAGWGATKSPGVREAFSKLAQHISSSLEPWEQMPERPTLPGHTWRPTDATHPREAGYCSCGFLCDTSFEQFVIHLQDVFDKARAVLQAPTRT